MSQKKKRKKIVCSFFNQQDSSIHHFWGTKIYRITQLIVRNRRIADNIKKTISHSLLNDKKLGSSFDSDLLLCRCQAGSMQLVFFFLALGTIAKIYSSSKRDRGLWGRYILNVVMYLCIYLIYRSAITSIISPLHWHKRKKKGMGKQWKFNSSIYPHRNVKVGVFAVFFFFKQQKNCVVELKISLEIFSHR